MNQCAAVTGFFLLGRCRHAAVTSCGHCQRPVCAQHSSRVGQCLECAEATDVYGPEYVTKLRRDTYRRTGHEYQDASWYSTVDDFERAPFDPEMGVDPDYSYGDQEYVDS